MAKTFDPNRVIPGTIELVRDANGNYTSKIVGLESINSLSLPEISTTAAVTKTDTDTKTATDITGDTVQKQTQMAFRTGDDKQIDTTGSMLQDEAKKTSDMLANVSTPTTIQDSMIRSNRFDAERFDETEDKISIEDPTSTVFGRPREGTIDQAAIDRQTQKSLGLDQPKVKGSAAVQRGEIEPPGIDFSFLKGDRFKEGTEFARPKEGTIDQAAADNMTQEQSATRAAKEAGFASGTLGITTAKPAETALDTQKFEGVSQMGALTGDEKQDVKPEVKQSALKTLGNSINTALRNIKTPGMMILESVFGPETDSQVHSKRYFNLAGGTGSQTQRIAGNPATDLYAGANRNARDLDGYGQKRIETREKTIAKKGYGPGDQFYDRTQKMKEDQKKYRESRKISDDKRTIAKAEKQKATQGPAGGSTTDSSSGGKIVCTMMNESYGFGSFRNKIWMKFHKDLSPEYQKGYHKLFLPLIKIAKTNKIVKNILEHIAIHSTIDMRQTLRGKKHTLGRLYRKILLPLCYWVGKI